MVNDNDPVYICDRPHKMMNGQIAEDILRIYFRPHLSFMSFSLGSGVKFASMSEEEVFSFQSSLIKIMMSLEDAFFNVAKSAGSPAGTSYLLSSRIFWSNPTCPSHSLRQGYDGSKCLYVS